MNAGRKQDQSAARRAQRSAAASPYARPSQKPKKSEPAGQGIPSSSSLSNIFSFLTAPFRKKEPETRPTMNDRDSETEVSRAMFIDDYEDDTESEPGSNPPQAIDFATNNAYTPATALSLRGQQMQNTLPAPIMPRTFEPVSRDDPRRTGRYIPKPPPRAPSYMDPAAPFNPPIPFPNSAPTPEPTPPPEQQVEQALDHMQVSPEKLDMVTSFLNEKRAAGASLTEIEAAGIVKLIQDSVNEGVRPLAASPSKSFAMSFGLSAPTTPIRPSKSEGSVGGSAPQITPSYTLPAFPPPDAPPSSIPVMKRDVKNPNPPLQYRGAGRSGRARTPAKSTAVVRASPAPVMTSSFTPTRYRSSVYGASLKETTQQLPALPSSESDVKRRKTNDGASQPVASSSAPSSSTKPSAASNPFMSSFTPPEASTSSTKTDTKPLSNGFLSTPSTPIAGSSLTNRPTFGVGTVNKSIPSKPSPLRQSMRPESPTSSPPQTVNGSAQASPATPSRVSRSFEVMQEIIEKNTPKKHDPLPEIANPYQTGSPFRAARKQPARKPASPVKAPAPQPAPPPPAPEKKELTALDLIEMSAPKNLKRSTAAAPEPPALKAPRPKSPSPPRIPGSGAPFIRSSFAPSPSQSLASNARKTAAAYVVDDDDDVEEVIEEPKAKRRKPSPPSSASPMVVDEVIDLDEEPAAAPAPAPKKPTLKTKTVQGVVRDAYKTKEPSPLRQSFQPDSPPETSKPAAAASPKDRARMLPESELPTFLFPSTPSSSAPADPFAPSAAAAAPLDAAKQRALSAPVAELPKFSFTASAVLADPPKFEFATSAPPAQPAFNWSAAGFKPPAKAAGAWACGECTLENAATATAKCAYCDAPKPGAAAAAAQPPPPAFNWGAAGFAMPAPKKDGEWTCGVCMLSNAAAAAKCTVCDAPKP